mmetsp:Transcript_41678/g.128770  ORF Transcript_41678/g.128770 Transcript_41678/m.128770 type:complete len:478 (-) Transcript_41678:622-2055(-)
MVVMNDGLEPVQRVEVGHLAREEREQEDAAEGEAVVAEEPLLVLLHQALLLVDHHLDVREAQRRHDHVEVPQVAVLARVVQLRLDGAQQHEEVVGAVGEAALQVGKVLVEHHDGVVRRGAHLRQEVLLLLFFVLLLVGAVLPLRLRVRVEDPLQERHLVEVRDVRRRLGDAAEAAGAHEAHVAEGVADLRDDLAELVEERAAVLRDAKLAHLGDELLRALHGEAAVDGVLGLVEVLDVLQQLRPDVVVVQELRDDGELLQQAAVHVVDRGVHDACSVRADGVGDVVGRERVQVLVVARGGALHEELLVQVVREVGDEHVDLLRDDKHVETLLDGPLRQLGLDEVEAVVCLGVVAHRVVRLRPGRVRRVELVEGLVQVVLDVVGDAVPLAEEAEPRERRQPRVERDLVVALDPLVRLVEHRGVGVHAQIRLDGHVERLQQLLLQRLLNVLLVLGDEVLRRPDVLRGKHQRDRVVQRHG